MVEKVSGVNESGTILRDATIADLTYIDTLRKREGNALGFIPIGAYQSVLLKAPADGRRRWLYSRLTVTEDNGDLTGFCYSSYAGDIARIIQIVVQDDARRWHRALLMADDCESNAIRFGKKFISCRVAVDLESNLFWRGIGYVPTKIVSSTWLNQRESKSKRPLVIYEKLTSKSLFSTETLAQLQKVI